MFSRGRDNWERNEQRVDKRMLVWTRGKEANSAHKPPKYHYTHLNRAIALNYTDWRGERKDLNA